MRVRRFLLPALILALGLTVVSADSARAQSPDKAAAEKYNDGLAKLKAKDYEGALTSFLDASSAASDAGDESTASKAEKYAYRLCYNVGVGYLKNGDIDKAMSFFDQGIAMEPTYYKNYKGKATILKKQGMVAEAIEAWVKTADVASEAGELDERRKARMQAEGFVAQAMQDRDFEKVIEVGSVHSQFSETSNVYYYMAHAQNQLGQYDAALESADKALELERGSRAARAKIYFEKAEAHKALSQYEDALDSYTQAAVGEFEQRARHEIEILSGSY